MASDRKRRLTAPRIILGLIALAVILFVLVPGSESGQRLTAAEFGDAWPLTVDNGEVECIPYAKVVFHSGGKTYAVNGLATTAKRWPDIREIWRDDPDNPGLKINIGPIIDRGLALCK